MDPAQSPTSSRHVAVIGAGAAGLVAARELRREGHSVVVFDREKQVGGLWIYSPKADSDPLSLDPTRSIVHSSLYESLRTNIPRECMGYSDFPFVPCDDVSRDSRRYPSHKEVLAYLEDFAREFKIEEMVRLETEVVRVEPVVVVIGNYASGADISRDICKVAKEVHIASRGCEPDTYEKLPRQKENIWMHSQIDIVREDGSIVFQNGKVIYADTIVHCTGYKYYFPFLETNGYINIDDNRIDPLYKHIFPPALAPGLSFIGLPAMGLQFYMFEVQSKWVAAVLSGRVTLPPIHNMMEDLILSYESLEALNIPKRNTHRLARIQCEYLNWIAEQCGFPHVEHWRDQEVLQGYKRLVFQPETFREEWDDDDLMKEAYEDFARQNLINVHPSRFLKSER